MTTYFYLPVPVIDPLTGDIPFNAVGSVYAPGDLATPLTVTMDGVQVTELQVSSAGYMPGFSILDVPMVLWVSGPYEVPLIPSGPPVPVGGTTGQALIKTSDVDHAMGWGTVSGGGGGDVTEAEVDTITGNLVGSGEGALVGALDTAYLGRAPVPVEFTTTGSLLIIAKNPDGTWPARPTDGTNVRCGWMGPDPSPEIVSSGTGGMLDNWDIRLVTP